MYETEPQGLREQAWFLNIVAEAATSLAPDQLLLHIRQIEEYFGRMRAIPNGPRTLDIDILFYADLVILTSDLEIPHSRYAARRFVLAPMADLAPEWRDPVSGKTIRYLLDELQGQTVRKFEEGRTAGVQK
jgi:2-amino-4-hydroxy-6-hydroxymethyldihydropteridine diphosphokinase